MVVWISRIINRTDSTNIIILSSIWLFALLMVNPIGDFPLNDDWCYGKTVKQIVETGEFKLYDWGAPTQFAQTIWGALFCLPFGFSFTALRFSTLILGLGGVLAIYGILRETGATKPISFLGALLVEMNPIYFALSNTFMTDVPFFSFASISFYFYIRFLNKDSIISVVIATFFSCAATLTRQIGIVMPVSFAVAYFIKEQDKENSFIESSHKNNYLRIFWTLIRAVIPTVIVVGLLITYIKILQYLGSFPEAARLNNSIMKRFLDIVDQGLVAVFILLLKNTLSVFTYLGLFFLPLLLLRPPNKLNHCAKKEIITIVIICLLLTIAAVEILIHNKRLMPFQHFGGNIIGNFYLGPPTLKDVFILNKKNLPKAPWFFWLTVTVVGIIGAFLLIRIIISQLFRLFQKKAKRPIQKNRYLLVFTFLTAFLFFAPLPPFLLFDRYLIPLFLPLLIIITSVKQPILSRFSMVMRRISALIVFLFILFSICGTHDNLAWNKARWFALNYLTEEQGISPRRIDGGFEFNGWNLYGTIDMSEGEKSWWWVDDDEYLIAFDDIRDYDVVKKFKYKRWLPPDSARIYILKKDDD